MAMLAAVELEDASMATDYADSYSVESPNARWQKVISHCQLKATRARALDTQRSAFLMTNEKAEWFQAKLERYRTKLERLRLDPASILEDVAEAPSSKSISVALNVLEYLLNNSIEPENVSLAADGGVAIRFKPEPSRRTYLEFLNDGGQHLLQYDDSGSVLIHQFPDFSPSQVGSKAIGLLQSIERVPPLARAD